MAAVKIGVIGCGGIAGVHMDILSKMPDVELAGFADVREEAAEKASAKYGGAFHTSRYRDLLATDLDGVLVCVPTFLHAEAATEALKAGMHVFCEKPMARTMEGAESMAQAAKESGKFLQFGFVRRFDDGWMAFRQAVQEKRIGRPVVWQDVQSHPGPGAAWYGQDDQGGGPFLDGCIHNIDFALHTFGPAERVFAHAQTFNPKNTALDTGTATVLFQSGDELLLAWSWGLPEGCYGGKVFQILGPEGMITWPERSGDSQAHFIVKKAGAQEEVSYPADALTVGYERQMEEFAAVIRGGRKPRAGVAEGLESLAVALGILHSGRTGELVQLRKS